MQELLEAFIQLGVAAKLSGQVLSVEVRAKPGSKREGLSVGPDGELVVAVRARAVEGEANAAIRELLARALGLSKGKVEMGRGERSKHKLFLLNYQFSDAKGPDHYLQKLHNSLEGTKE